MKRLVIIVGVILGVLGLVYATNKKTLTSNKSTTGSNGTDTPEEGKPTTKVLVSEKMGLTYEGQAIYKKYKGIAATGSQIGYLIDGFLLTTANTIYENGEYKKRTPPNPPSGDVPNNILGTFLVDNTYKIVYQKKQGVNLANYPNSLGFLANGSIVYVGITNPGEPSETTYYYT